MRVVEMLGGPQERALRVELVERAHRLYEMGLIAGLDGNLSARFGGRWLLATPAGMAKGDLRPEDLVLLDFGPASMRNGLVTTNPRVARARRGRTPSSELPLHLAAYAARPEIGAVVHAHPPGAVALTLGAATPALDICPESVLFLGEVGVAPYAAPGTDDLARSIEPLIQRCDTILLARHGALAVGTNLALAHQRMESLEHVARIYLAGRSLGPVSSLPKRAKAHLHELAGEMDPDAIVAAVLDELTGPQTRSGS